MIPAATHVPLPAGARAPLFTVLGAQLLTALADNALLIVAIALLETRQAAGWATPALRVAFYGAYVVLAPLAGRLADRVDKARLMAAVNLLKLAGALALLAGLHPLLVFAAIGLGASAYAPARYGILPELASGRALLRANAGMEIVTIVAILGGTALGSALVAPAVLQLACAVLAGLYGLAALCTAFRRTAARAHAGTTVRFLPALAVLLADRPARAAIALTSVFWAAAAVLQAALAVGMVAGSTGAAQLGRVPAPGAATAMAVLLGGAIVLLSTVASVAGAVALMVAAGVLAGALLVPLNATLQERGASLVGAGQAVAVQNCVENGLSLVFLAGYGGALALGASNRAALAGLGIVVLVLLGGGELLQRQSQPGAPC